MRNNYRIRQLSNPIKLKDLIGVTIKIPSIKPYYIVEKRILWFWWFSSNLGIPGLNIFDIYEDAVEWVKRIKGNLLFTC